MIFNLIRSMAKRAAKYAVYPWAIHFLLPALIWIVFSYSGVVDMLIKMYWWGFVSGPLGLILGEPFFHQPYAEGYWVPAYALTYLLVGVFWYAIFFLLTCLLILSVTLNDAYIKWREKP
jgi:hypothetical protein